MTIRQCSLNRHTTGHRTFFSWSIPDRASRNKVTHLIHYAYKSLLCLRNVKITITEEIWCYFYSRTCRKLVKLHNKKIRKLLDSLHFIKQYRNSNDCSHHISIKIAIPFFFFEYIFKLILITPPYYIKHIYMC